MWKNWQNSCSDWLEFTGNIAPDTEGPHEAGSDCETFNSPKLNIETGLIRGLVLNSYEVFHSTLGTVLL